MKKGILIAIEGIDGSGKGTQCKLLMDSLHKNGDMATLFQFPQYESSFFGKEVGDYLHGKYGNLEQVHPKFSALLYALDRFESRDKIISSLDAGHIVICDRYSFSNIAHQSARAPQNEKKSMAEWVSKVEYEILGLPTADLILFLDSTTERSQELVSKKDKRIYTDKTHDIQESSNEHLSEALIQFRALAEKEDWTVIPCLNSSNAMRSISDIHQEILKYVTDFIKHR
ncbi:dTMP kinase [Aeromonas hydrophila]|uniref:dTMP kinase n=1 Tax=Aeromonas hydrophila TaxID=644 RepID=UPI00398956F5